jgi:hypothetical protein
MRNAVFLNAILFVVLLAIPITAAEVWSPNPCVAVFKGPDYSGKDDAECAIRIVGTPNGAFTGQVVVYSKEPMKLEPASVTDLKLKDGEAAIPASQIAVRYALHELGDERTQALQGNQAPRAAPLRRARGGTSGERERAPRLDCRQRPGGRPGGGL